MSDLKHWSETSKTSRNLVVVFTVFMATLGGLNAIGDLYVKWKNSQKPETPSVAIEVMDFQEPNYDKVTLNFRNATTKIVSINSVGLICKLKNGNAIQLVAINNELGKFKHILKVDSNQIELTPKLLKLGESIRLDTFYQKQLQNQAIPSRCVQLAPIWTDNEYQINKGGWVELQENEVYWSQTIQGKS